ncbi:MAG TPA: BACON domain-containing carbohydrate-binding protein [Vicinamibacterales bacterium]|nr:BACON domain-containing carbohydrate-binding protein [Vicinamibacterales bacterium]
MTTAPSPAKCEVTLSTPTISANGGSGTLTVTTRQECGWSATSQANWISSISPATGQGNGQVAFAVAPNPTRVERQGEIVVNDARAQVRQEAGTCQFTIASTNQDFGNRGGTGTVTVTGIQGCPWTARSNASWITITPPSTGDGSGSVEFRVTPNSQGVRSGTMTIAGREFTVTQSAGDAPTPGPTPTPGPAPTPGPTPTPPGSPTPPAPSPSCTYTVNEQSQPFPFGGSTGGSVSVSAPNGCAWTAQSNTSWITITSGASSSGNGTATFSVAANSGLARTGTVTVASRTVTVTQVRDPATCRYTLNPSGGSFAHTGGSLSMSVSTDSDCSWTSTGSASWIAIASGANGSGNGTVTVNVASNSGGLARSGSVTVGSTTVAVSQVRDPATCRYSIDPGGATLPSGGGGGSINVSTASDCRWVVGATSSWLVITSGSGGNWGAGSISWSAGSNTGPPRTAEILVSGLSFEVTQAGS